MESKVVRVNKTLYVRIPAADARRLHLQEGQVVDLEVKAKGVSAAEIFRTQLGACPDLVPLTDDELWGDL